MACSQLTVFVPVMTRTVLMSVMFLLYIRTGSGMNYRPIWTGSDCITVNQDRVDFKTAADACRDSNGQLLTFEAETDESTFDILSRDLFGNFWIGLHLPAGACSNLSAPLRGYEWTSGNVDRSFIPSSSIWKDSVKLCSPHCVSLSNDQKWTERLCSDKTDGYLCKTKHKDACIRSADPVFFRSTKGCSSGPCQQTCKDVKGGYMCSCFSGYIPDSKDPRQCKMHCAQQKCPAICEKNTDSACSCPDGFLINNDTSCEDIDECVMDGCDQECENTFGSFVCSCKEGFVLKDEVKCIKAKGSGGLVITTPVAEGSVKPAASNNTLKASSATAGGFLWIWIVVAVAVVVFIFVIRFHIVKRQRRREHNLTQQSTVTAPVGNIEC